VTSTLTHPANPADPALVLASLRAVYQTRLLVAATFHLDLFEQFAAGPRTLEEIRKATGLAERPAMVLLPALCAQGMLVRDPASGRFSPTASGRSLTRAAAPGMLGYLAFSAEDPDVIEMANLLRHDGPVAAPDAGIAYVKEGAGPSPMDDPDTARLLTMRLAGRARLLSPLTARALPGGKRHLLDVACGSGYYTYEWLLANPEGTATVLDRPAVLAIAEECLEDFCREKNADLADFRRRVRFHPGDMLADELPRADVVLAFSLFHDWPGETCEILAGRFAGALNPGGTLWVHDEFLDDTLDGPLEAALYGAQLFWITKGRIYSRAEHRAWFEKAGLKPLDARVPTALNYSLIAAGKPG
jgi:SAM-dependent methyltransferase